MTKEKSPPSLPPPPDTGRVTLLSDWGRYTAPSVLAVLVPGQNPERGFIDAARAAQLVEDGLAVYGAPPPAEDPPRRRRKEAS